MFEDMLTEDGLRDSYCMPGEWLLPISGQMSLSMFPLEPATLHFQHRSVWHSLTSCSGRDVHTAGEDRAVPAAPASLPSHMSSPRIAHPREAGTQKWLLARKPNGFRLVVFDAALLTLPSCRRLKLKLAIVGLRQILLRCSYLIDLPYDFWDGYSPAIGAVPPCKASRGERWRRITLAALAQDPRHSMASIVRSCPLDIERVLSQRWTCIVVLVFQIMNTVKP